MYVALPPIFAPRSLREASLPTVPQVMASLPARSGKVIACEALPTLTVGGVNKLRMQQDAHSWFLGGAGLDRAIAESHVLWQAMLLLPPRLLLLGMLPPPSRLLQPRKALQCSTPMLRAVEGCLHPGDVAVGYQGMPIASADLWGRQRTALPL